MEVGIDRIDRIDRIDKSVNQYQSNSQRYSITAVM